MGSNPTPTANVRPTHWLPPMQSCASQPKLGGVPIGIDRRPSALWVHGRRINLVNTMNRHLRLGLAALCTLNVLAAGAAQTPSPTAEQQAEEAVKFRQADMDMQAYSIAPVLPMLQGAAFDAATVQKAAARLTVMMEMLADVFRTDTSGFPIKTKARPTIWTDALGFESKILDMQAAVQNMTAAAKGDDSKATLQAARNAVGTCRACHEKYGNGLN